MKKSAKALHYLSSKASGERSADKQIRMPTSQAINYNRFGQ